jgi:chemotaxis protein methyltransferase CheR
MIFLNSNKKSMPLTEAEVKRFKEEVLEFSDYDFSGYSIKSFTRRLDKILTDNSMTLDALLKKMRHNKNFLEEVIKEITVNTTEPFRTPVIWNKLIPLIKNKFHDLDTINIWHAGCSTGLEVYSMMIILYEMGLFDKARIFGTDLNEDVLATARSGKYRLHDFDDYWNNINEVMKDFKDFDISNYLDINKRRRIIKMKSFLVEKPSFVRQNLIKDGNIFGIKFDLIMCRNVLIYFDHDLQDRIFNFFYETLTDDGILVIGKHESILSPIQRKFERIESIYVKKNKDDIWNF